MLAEFPRALPDRHGSISHRSWEPPLGGWALDQIPAIAHGFWLAASLSIVPCLATLLVLEKLVSRSEATEVIETREQLPK